MGQFFRRNKVKKNSVAAFKGQICHAPLDYLLIKVCVHVKEGWTYLKKA